MGWKSAIFYTALAGCFTFFDGYWFLRLTWCYLSSKIRKQIREEGVVYGICSTNDLDFMGHMNNARYLRELDFARFDFFLRSGLSAYIFGNTSSSKAKMYCVIQAVTIRYRRSIDFLQIFCVQTRLIWWTDKIVFMEHRFVTISDGFVRAVAFSACHVVNCDVEIMMMNIGFSKPNIIPSDLQKWMEFNTESSKKLRLEAPVSI